MKQHYPSLQDAININSGGLSKALSSISLPFHCIQNEMLVYHKTFSMVCPWSSTCHRLVNFFYRCTNGKPPKDPSSALVCSYVNQAHLYLTRAQSDVIVACSNVDKHIQMQATNMNVTPQKKPITTLSTISVTPSSNVAKTDNEDENASSVLNIALRLITLISSAILWVSLACFILLLCGKNGHWLYVFSKIKGILKIRLTGKYQPSTASMIYAAHPCLGTCYYSCNFIQSRPLFFHYFSCS